MYGYWVSPNGKPPKKMREVPKRAAPKTKKIEIARILLWALFVTPQLAPPHQTRLQILGAPGAPGNRRKAGQSQLPLYSPTKGMLARTSNFAAI